MLDACEGDEAFGGRFFDANIVKDGDEGIGGSDENGDGGDDPKGEKDDA